MADLSDVENALVVAITAVVYPNGPADPSAVNSGGVNINLRVFPGLPIPTRLDADLAAGNIVNISCYAQPGLEKNTTRYPTDWVNQTTTTPSITATVAGLTITLGGTIVAGQYVTAIVGTKAYSYALLGTDTLATAATGLAALINVNTVASASGAVITTAGTPNGVLVARTGAPNTSFRELERTNQRFQVGIWAPSNALRVATAVVVRPGLAALDYLTYPDTSCGRILYEMSNDLDRSAKQSLMCRDLFYWIEYPTTQVMTSYPVTAFNVGLEVDEWTTPDYTPLPWSGFNPTVTNIS